VISEGGGIVEESELEVIFLSLYFFCWVFVCLFCFVSLSVARRLFQSTIS